MITQSFLSTSTYSNIGSNIGKRIAIDCSYSSYSRLFTVFLLLTSFIFLSACENQKTASLDSKIADTHGNTYTWNQFKDQWLVINFWASWCGPCREEVPELNELQKMRNDIQIIGISFDPLKLESLKKESEKLGFEFPVFVGDTTSLLGIEKPSVLPSTFIFAPGLKHFKTLRGPQTASKLNQLISKGTIH